MKRKILAMLLVLVTVLGMFPTTASAASSEEEALGEIKIFSDGTSLDYLSINGAARTQKYTYYNYKDQSGATKEIPAYCINPNTKGVPQAVPAGTGIDYLANQKCTDTKVLGIVASGYPHVALDKLGLNSKYEAYYATKMALWYHLLSNWSVYDLKVNPGCSNQAAAQRVLKAAKEIYQTGMYWTKPLNPKLTATPDQPNTQRDLMQPDEVLRLDRRKCIALFQGHKPALLYKLAPEEFPDYGKLKSCRLIDYVPKWKQREDESAAQTKEPAAKPTPPAPAQQQKSEAPSEINPAEDLEYQVETAAQSGNSGLGMVEITIDGVCGEDEDSPPGR